MGRFLYFGLSFGHFVMPIMGVISLWLLTGTQALLAGLMVSVIFKNPYAEMLKRLTHYLLAFTIVGLGAGMDFLSIGEVGFKNLPYTFFGLVLFFLVGKALGTCLKTSRDTSLLISVGSGICGGSAILAVAPVINAHHQEVAVSLGIVFLLNAIALMIFPAIGHYYQLSEGQFGLWCAFAIHDTSSVLGASLQFGAHALLVGTTVKLTRALWIMPVAIIIGFVRRMREGNLHQSRTKLPWFIVGFFLMAALMTWQPALKPLGQVTQFLSRHFMVLILFLIGASLRKETLRQVGIRPLLQGTLLWGLMSTLSLVLIKTEIIIAP